MFEKKVIGYLSQADDWMIEDAAPSFESNCDDKCESKCDDNKVKPVFRRRWALIAACLCIIIVGSFGGYMVVAEAREYSEAVSFFSEKGLSTEGLERGEIKKIYKDIVTRSFKYEKTVKVIEEAVKNNSISGYEFMANEPSPDEIIDYWTINGDDISPANRDVWRYRIKREGRWYDWEFSEKENSYITTCYENDKVVWAAKTGGSLRIDNVKDVEGGAIGCGDASHEEAWICKFDSTGKILWKYPIGGKHIDFIYNNGDTVEFIGRTGEDLIGRWVYDLEGNRRDFTATKIPYEPIAAMSKTEDGYILAIRAHQKEPSLIMLDNNLSQANKVVYEEKGYNTFFKDVISYGGKTVISAFTAKKSSDTGSSGRGEIDAVLEWCEENWKSKAPYESEKLLKVVRDNFTAVLLVCDDKTGNPDKLYSVNGSFGGLLSIDKNGDLVWQTENIVNSGYSPATSAFSIICDCKNIEYTFETESGKVNKRETDETSSYKF